MANPTSNFGWQMPTNTDLVKDLPADFEVFGQAVDTSLMDLKGGTTGQVLSKASDTDMDFTWVAQDDSNAIQNAIVDAKGDLITATAADTPARLAVGANDTVLTADSSTATGLKWATLSSGGMTLISTTTLANATVTLSSIPQTYNALYILIQGMTANSSNARFRCAPNGTTNIATYTSIDNTTLTQTVSGYIRISEDNTLRTDAGNGWVIIINDYTTSSTWKPLTFYGSYQDAGSVRSTVFAGGSINSSNAITSLVFDYEGTNTFAGGTVKLYGVK